MPEFAEKSAKFSVQGLCRASGSGEANGLPIVFREDGYISATSVSHGMKKRLDNFWANEETQKYIETLSKFTGIPGNILKETKRGRNGGTFCHPKLAVKLARWMDQDFEVWCDLMIDNILKGNIQTTVVVPVQDNTQYDCALSI